MVLDTSKHYPVLLNEIISIISTWWHIYYCTFGRVDIQKNLSNETKVIALIEIIIQKNSRQNFKQISKRILFKNKNCQLNDLKLKEKM